jgi:hypothetical protein
MARMLAPNSPGPAIPGPGIKQGKHIEPAHQRGKQLVFIPPPVPGPAQPVPDHRGGGVGGGGAGSGPVGVVAADAADAAGHRRRRRISKRITNQDIERIRLGYIWIL